MRIKMAMQNLQMSESAFEHLERIKQYITVEIETTNAGKHLLIKTNNYLPEIHIRCENSKYELLTIARLLQGLAKSEFGNGNSENHVQRSGA